MQTAAVLIDWLYHVQTRNLGNDAISIVHLPTRLFESETLLWWHWLRMSLFNLLPRKGN